MCQLLYTESAPPCVHFTRPYFFARARSAGFRSCNTPGFALFAQNRLLGNQPKRHRMLHHRLHTLKQLLCLIILKRLSVQFGSDCEAILQSSLTVQSTILQSSHLTVQLRSSECSIRCITLNPLSHPLSHPLSPTLSPPPSNPASPPHSPLPSSAARPQQSCRPVTRTLNPRP